MRGSVRRTAIITWVLSSRTSERSWANLFEEFLIQAITLKQDNKRKPNIPISLIHSFIHSFRTAEKELALKLQQSRTMRLKLFVILKH